MLILYEGYGHSFRFPRCDWHFSMWNWSMTMYVVSLLNFSVYLRKYPRISTHFFESFFFVDIRHQTLPRNRM